MWRARITVWLLLFILLTACSASNHSDSASILLYEGHSGQVVELRIHETFQILLDSNPSTGYSWNIEQIDLDLLEQIGEPQFTSDSDLPGSGGTTVFMFQTIAVGQTMLRLIYHRTWEEDMPPLKTFEITVMITP